MTKPQAQGILNFLDDFLNDRLNRTFDKHHKKALMNEMNGLLSSMIPQDQPPQPDTEGIKKVKGVPITPKGLNSDENENKE